MFLQRDSKFTIILIWSLKGEHHTVGSCCPYCFLRCLCEESRSEKTTPDKRLVNDTRLIHLLYFPFLLLVVLMNSKEKPLQNHS